MPKVTQRAGSKGESPAGKGRSPAGGSCPSLGGVQRQLSPAPGRRHTGQRWRTSAARSWPGHSSGRSQRPACSPPESPPGGVAGHQPRAQSSRSSRSVPAWRLRRAPAVGGPSGALRWAPPGSTFPQGPSLLKTSCGGWTSALAPAGHPEPPLPILQNSLGYRDRFRLWPTNGESRPGSHSGCLGNRTPPEFELQLQPGNSP